MTASAVVALGEGLIEFNQTPNDPNLFRQGFGGDTSNTAIACARQGVSAGYISRVGGDEFGAMLTALWQSEGIDTSSVLLDQNAATGAYVITHDETGHRFSYLRHGSAASRITPNDLPAERISQARFLHVSGISQGISETARATVAAALSIARNAGTQISYDPNLRLRLWDIECARPVILETLAVSDLFLPSLDDMRLLIGVERPDDALDWCFRHGAKTVVLKLGAHGCVVATPHSRTSFAGHAVKSVDATGAGDCFDGVLLARLVSGDEMPEAARRANLAAALATTGYGAVAPIPRRSDILAPSSGG